MFRVIKNEASSKTVRMPDRLIERLEIIAQENNISFNKVVVQCCQYALDSIDKKEKSQASGETN